MRWIGWAAWHVGEWLYDLQDWWYRTTNRLPGWLEADNADFDRGRYFVENCYRCAPLDLLLERQKRG